MFTKPYLNTYLNTICYVSQLYNCLKFSQPSLCLEETMYLNTCLHAAYMHASAGRMTEIVGKNRPEMNVIGQSV